MAKLNSFFSGTVGPQGDRPGPDSFLGRLLLYIVGILLFPFALIIYAVWLSLFTYARLPWWIPGAAGLTLLAGGLVTGQVGLGAVQFYIHGYANWWNDVTVAHRDVFDAFFDNLGGIIVGQLWLGLLAATLWAGIVCAWKWVRRPAWQEKFITPGPILKRRARKTAEEIARGVNSPVGGVTLGVSNDLRDPRFAGGAPGAKYGSRVVLSDAELSAHAFIVGGSGSGKTQSMLSGIRDVIRQGHGVVFIDCKASPVVTEQIAEWAQRNGREFLHWTIQDPSVPYDGPAEGPAYYDPISRGDASRRKDLLIGSQRWDVEYYKEIISNYLQTMFKVRDLVPPLEGVDTFTDVADLLNPSALIRRASYIDAEAHTELTSALTRFSSMDTNALSGINGMYSRLHTLTSSTAGQWLRRDPEGRRDIDLRRVADEGQVVVFSLDGDLYEATASLIAGLIIQDLKTLSSELRNDAAPSPLHVYIDEFSAVDTSNLLGLLARARESKMPCMLATQALADLARREPTFPKQVLGIVSTFIIHRANDEDDARIYAGLSGITRKMVERRSFEHSSGVLGTMGAATATGAGYAEERDEHQVHVGTFQRLRQGEAVLIVKSPVSRYVNTVKVIREDPMVPESVRDRPIEVHEKKTVRREHSERVTYPHPLLVETGQVAHPSAASSDVNPLEVLAAGQDAAAPSAAQKGKPRRPGSTPPAAPGVAAGSPLVLPGSPQTPSRPPSTPMAPSRPASRPPVQNPEEWNGIP